MGWGPYQTLRQFEAWSAWADAQRDHPGDAEEFLSSIAGFRIVRTYGERGGDGADGKGLAGAFSAMMDFGRVKGGDKLLARLQQLQQDQERERRKGDAGT